VNVALEQISISVKAAAEAYVANVNHQYGRTILVTSVLPVTNSWMKNVPEE
jgi:hypothetical protein